MGREGVRRDFVMLGDCAVDAEDYGSGFGGQVSATQGTFFALDADCGSIDYVTHFATIAL